MKAIIPTGGRGTRMQPLTFSTNKHFIPIANKPLIFYPIETVANAGIKDIAITYNPGWLDVVKKYLGDGSKWGLNFEFVLQDKPLGLANVFQVCEEFLQGESFVFHLGDNIFVDGIKNFVDHFEKERPDGLVTMVHHPENRRMGVPYFDEQGRLIEYVEKPDNPPHDFAIPGLYFFNANVFKCFKGKESIQPSPRGEFEISAPYQWLIDHKYRVDVLEYKGKWLDPGKFNDWIEANQYLLDVETENTNEAEVDVDSHIENRVRIGKGSIIIKSEIRGPVNIGENVTIENSYIGPFTSISDRCEIRHSHVENSVLLDGVHITNLKHPLNESLIGSDAEVYDEDGPTDWVKLFIGEKSVVKI
jgi:glucose-1-phosphate thymidylyltransferase